MESSVSATLTIPGGTSPEPFPPGYGSPEARVVTSDGDVVLLVPAGAPAAQLAAHAQGDEVTAVMEITDVAPVAVPRRIRGRAWVAGWLTAVRAEDHVELAGLIAARHPDGPFADTAWRLLRLEVGEAYVEDLWGEAHVEPDDFAAASPDPLAPYEAELLQHLAAAHQDQLHGLCGLLGERGAACAASGGTAVPLSVDRHGMRVRFCGVDTGIREDAEDCFDVRFEFPEPVGDVAQLRRAMRMLFEAADG